ncbi:hypothetical protein [Mesobacillus foraminis]|uniref:hypothetical protein n=1 Tax=Mesobacillus foraminis TaxID=279826 RepID=UPI0013CEB8F9|nr:hypothetical protein [Mesobacillus foraminis]
MNQTGQILSIILIKRNGLTLMVSHTVGGIIQEKRDPCYIRSDSISSGELTE